MADDTSKPSHGVVSSEDEVLILVDETDRVVGHLAKGACHDGAGVLHRAFSIFVFNRSGKLLLQKRSDEKRLWPLFWSNSCCSHPRRGESMETAVGRRLQQELGVAGDFRFLFKFQYQVSYEDIGSENELCSVFAGVTDDVPRPNPHEISDHRWVSPSQLDDEIAATPEIFTPWLRLEWPRVRAADLSTFGL